MSIPVLILALLCSAPAQAQVDLGSIQTQMRDIFQGRPAPAGIGAPKLTGAPVRLAAAPAANDYKGADFTLKDTSGRAVSISQFAGSYVLLDFSATWCGPCNASIPRLQEISEAYAGKGLVVIAVYSEEKDLVAEHLKEAGAKYQALIDPTQAVSNKFLVRAFPTFHLLGPDGTRLGMGVGQGGIETLLRKYKQAAGQN